MIFPDVEDALVEILDDLAPWVGTMTDEEIDPPLIVVGRTGGGAVGPFDTARVTVECLAPSRAESKALTKAVREKLSGARGVLTEAGFIDSIDEDLSPTPIPYEGGYDNIRLTTSNWVVQTRSTD